MPTTEHTDTTANSLPLRTSIIATIRKKIFSGEYPADCILSLTAVANEMNVSRTPVREAFQFLANEGLLELRPNRSAIVNGITDQYIREHYELRILLEGEACSLATRNRMETSSFFDWITNLPPLCEETLNEYRCFNQEFHLSIWKAAGNSKMEQILLSLWNGPSFGRCISELKHTELSLQEHTAILNAIADDRPERARCCMQEHIRRSMNSILTRPR